MKKKTNSIENLRTAILTQDESVLNEELIEALLKINPTQEEIEAIIGFDGEKSQLSEVCQFIGQIFGLPRIADRIKVQKFYLEYQGLYNKVRDQCECF